MAAAHINQGVHVGWLARFVDVIGEDHAAVAADVEFVGLRVAHVQHRCDCCCSDKYWRTPRDLPYGDSIDRYRQRHGEQQHRLIQPQRAGAQRPAWR